MSSTEATNWITSSWKGDQPAYKVFWVYAVPINLAFFITGLVAGVAAGSIPQVSLLVFLVAPLYLIFTVWFCVSLWRCAYNADWDGWAWIARAWVIIVGVGMFIQIVRFVGLILR